MERLCGRAGQELASATAFVMVKTPPIWACRADHDLELVAPDIAEGAGDVL
jgi:hypothetical protein